MGSLIWGLVRLGFPSGAGTGEHMDYRACVDAVFQICSARAAGEPAEPALSR